MKILAILGLILLVSCGGKNKTQVIDNTKTIASAKVYGKHVQITYDDGSTQWIHPEGHRPIVDLDAHRAKADSYISFWNRNCGNGSCEFTIDKLVTLMGDGWIVIKQVTGLNTNSPQTIRFAMNMAAYQEPFPEHTALEDDFIFSVANNLILESDGIYRTQGAVYGFYNKDSYNGHIYSSSTGPGEINFLLREHTDPNSWEGSPVDNGRTEADIGIDSFTKENFYFEESTDNSKDLEKFGVNIEIQDIEKLSERLADYGMSADRSQKIAKLANYYSKLTSKRALNAKEKDMFTKELTGLSFDQAATQMVEDYDGLIEKAAELNETSPEAIKELINTIM